MPIAVLLLLALVVLLGIWTIAAVVHTVFLLIPIILIGIVAGWAASQIVGSRYGAVGTTLVGVAGSFIGPLLFALFNIASGGFLPHIIASILGATLLLAGLRAVDQRRLPAPRY